MRQQSLALRTWGGRRRGAGRKPAPGREAIRHDPRGRVAASHPVHVTMRMAEHVWNLRSERSFRIFDAALRRVRTRPDFRVVHFSVLGNHVHLLVEADGASALANGMRALGIRLARRLNAMMGRSGSVFSARYHAHVLRTPAEVRNALRYVLGNFASHCERRGERVPAGGVDRFSSASGRGGLQAQQVLFEEAATSAPRTWLLKNGQRSRPRGAAAPQEAVDGSEALARSTLEDQMRSLDRDDLDLGA